MSSCHPGNVRGRKATAVMDSTRDFDTWIDYNNPFYVFPLVAVLLKSFAFSKAASPTMEER